MRIGFNDLSGGLRALVIVLWFVLGIFVVYFFFGVLNGLLLAIK